MWHQVSTPTTPTHTLKLPYTGLCVPRSGGRGALVVTCCAEGLQKCVQSFEFACCGWQPGCVVPGRYDRNAKLRHASVDVLVAPAASQQRCPSKLAAAVTVTVFCLSLCGLLSIASHSCVSAGQHKI